MGHRIAISGRLSFPASRASSLRDLVVDPAAFDDWPDTALVPAGTAAPFTADAVLALFTAEALSEITWAHDEVRVALVVPADAERWASAGRSLITLFRASGAVGASGGVALTRWSDDSSAEVLSVKSKGDGSSTVSVLTGTAAERAALAIREHVDHLAAHVVTEPVDPPGGPPVLPLAGPELAHHRSVVSALRARDPEHVLELARALDLPGDAETYAFSPSSTRRDPLTTKRRTAEALLSSLELGWAGLERQDARRLARRALEILARVDRDQAKALAANALESGVLGRVGAYAEALVAGASDR